MLQVTPNGPWGKDVHPKLPVSLDELLADLRECFRAGATGVHLHVRDRSGADTLDPAVVAETCRQVRDVATEVGVRAEIGLTTGAWIAKSTCPRLTHGMNAWTWPLIADAFRRRHHTRVGFEDSVYLPDGTEAQSNAHLVQTALELYPSLATSDGH